MLKRFQKIIVSAYLLFFSLITHQVMAQAELQPWGNLAGTRIEGQLMQFETNISVVFRGWNTIKSTGKEMQRPKYERKGLQQIVTTDIDSLHFVETVTDEKNNSAKINVRATGRSIQPLDGIYVKLAIPNEFYPTGTLMYDEYEGISLTGNTETLSYYLRKPVKEIHLMSAERDLYLNFETPTIVIIKNEKSKKGFMHHALYIPIQK